MNEVVANEVRIGDILAGRPNEALAREVLDIRTNDNGCLRFVFANGESGWMWPYSPAWVK